jgi:hypothetical protein
MHSQQFSLKALAATLFATSVSAHMLMSSPMPYGASTLDNSPLVADGSDFPCKQRTGVYDLEGASNTLAVGGTYPLTFVGTAVHGGGSCQVSLSTDLQPTASSKWMVITSIEGGCPADVPGNLDVGGATTPDPYTFNYTVPEGIAPGDYTIAWSWSNKVGNREFYMNCGPATITAATKKRYAPNAATSKNTKRQSSFPGMFVANLASVNSCTTIAEFDYEYPNPGSNVQKSADGNFGSGTSSGIVGSNCEVGGSDAEASSPTATAAAAAGSSSAGASSAGASSASAGIFATGTASVPAAATETVSPVPAAASSPPASVASAAPAAPSSSSTTTSGAVVAGAACTPEGEWACSADGTSYQRCASGVWSVSMEMAAGTSCTPGVSDTLSENVTNAKRAGFHARRSHHAYARLS